MCTREVRTAGRSSGRAAATLTALPSLHPPWQANATLPTNKHYRLCLTAAPRADPAVPAFSAYSRQCVPRNFTAAKFGPENNKDDPNATNTNSMVGMHHGSGMNTDNDDGDDNEEEEDEEDKEEEEEEEEEGHDGGGGSDSDSSGGDGPLDEHSSSAKPADQPRHMMKVGVVGRLLLLLYARQEIDFRVESSTDIHDYSHRPTHGDACSHYMRKQTRTNTHACLSREPALALLPPHCLFRNPNPRPRSRVRMPARQINCTVVRDATTGVLSDHYPLLCHWTGGHVSRRD